MPITVRTRGNEVIANTYTTNDQLDPVITSLSGGGYVTVWHSLNQDGSNFGIYAQRWNASGAAVGGEFRVNTNTDYAQIIPTVTGLTGGGFVVSWMTVDSTGNDQDIRAQIFDATGAAVGSEFLVNTYTTNSQSESFVTALSGGGFVIAWTSDGQDGTDLGTYAQIYDAAGQTVGSELLVNTTTSSSERHPNIAPFSDGGFIVTWTSTTQDGSNSGVFAQRFNSTGVPQGSEFQVNTYTTNAQNRSYVAVLTDGTFVVTWTSDGQDGSGLGVYAQRFSANGGAIGAEFRINLTTAGDQQASSIQPLAEGRYIVTWMSSGQDGDSDAVVARLFDSDGTALTPEFIVNTTTSGAQGEPNVAVGTDGGFTVVWQSLGQDGDLGGIYQRTYAVLGNASDLTAGTEYITGTASDDIILALSNGLDAGDIVNGLGGIDTIRLSEVGILDARNGTLTSIERLEGSSGNDTIYGTANGETLQGGDGVDTLIGGGGNDRLDGGSALDIMSGGTGDDTYVLTSSTESVTENNGEGTDTIEINQNYTLGANFENLTLTGLNNDIGQGNELNNVIIGNSGNNGLAGMSGDDALIGGAGNDSLNGGSGSDSLSGGEGDDTYDTDGLDTLTENANEGTDTVRSTVTFTLGANFENLTLNESSNINGTGNSGNNVITGNSGNNTLNGAGGTDTMAGGAGDDIYVTDGGDTITENANEGTDTVQSSATIILSANVENLTLTGSAAINGTGNSGNNTITGNSGNNILDGGGGQDMMSGGAGNDTYITDGSDGILEYQGEGTDTIISSVSYSLMSNIENLTLTGSADLNGNGNELDNVFIGNTGNNLLSGAGGADRLEGGDGNDRLDGGIGSDTLIGGLGNDTYVIDANDTFTENANEGTDTIEASFTYTLGANFENLTLITIGDINGTGNSGDNTITGNSGNNTLDGAEGDDTLIGGAGDDSLWGTTGTDTLIGGTGDDIYYLLQDTLDTVVELSGEGNDTIVSGYTYSLASLSAVENLTLGGLGSINGTGNASANAIIGNTADNTLDGAGGADFMMGGAGNDVYVVDNAGDSLIEWANEGTDTVQSSVTYTLGSNVENLTLTGTGNINGTGNELNNVITGNSGNNTLNGGAGNDTLSGGGGADLLRGGAGDDTYIITAVSMNTLEVAENANEGTDTVQSSVTFFLGENIENLVLTGSDNIVGSGNSGNNTITGNSGNNSLRGEGGTDTLIGGAGNDQFYVDDATDVATENANEGTSDWVISTATSYTLGDNIEQMTLQSTGNIDGTGNSLSNTMWGGDGNNRMDGQDGIDIIESGAGNDTLIGGAGNDFLTGGTGDDIYVVDSAGDLLTELLNEGTDTVQSSVSFTLGANIENLTLTGTDNINGTGNSLDNTITGNSGNNTLDGSGGADTLIGGAGSDIYVVDHIYDVVVENANEGTDTVEALRSYALGANVENLTLTGNDVVDGTGNAASNVIRGNANLNYLDGREGADTLIGGAGNDTYVVDNVGDIVVEQQNEGALDAVITSISYALTANVENLSFSGSASINGTGNSLDNLIRGNSGNNILDGGAGVDLMFGGLGDDTYIVDQLADMINESANEGVDTVQTSQASYSLAVLTHVENLTGTSSSGQTLTGNASANTLRGGIGADVLDGGAGVDTLIGGAGNDIYIVDNAGDVVTETSGNGTSDTIRTALQSYTLTNSAHIERLDGLSDGGQTLTGNGLDNTIASGAGNDTLDGGSGADTLIGGLGDDSYLIDQAGDIITELSGQGTDTVRAAFNYTLGSNLENLVLTGAANLAGTGNALANTLTGNFGANILDGGAGSDTLTGGAGDDTFVYGANSGADVITDFTVAGGIDRIDLQALTSIWSITQLLVIATQSGSDTVLNFGAGNTLTLRNVARTSLIEDDFLFASGPTATANGTTGNDEILGTGANDTLDGLAGNDRINGGSGDDRIIYDAADTPSGILGGVGVDTLVITNGGSLPTSFNLASQGFERAERAYTDPGSAQPWASLVETYDTNWQLLQEDRRNDDGSRRLTSFDTAGIQLWASSVQEFNAADQRLVQRSYNDNGTYEFYYWDPLNTQGWDNLLESFNAAGQRTLQRIYNDDGSYRFFYWDLAGVENWTTFDEEFNTAGGRHTQRISYDTGDQRYFYWDVSNAQSWNQFDDQYNGSGQRTLQTIVNDDGTISQQYWDVAGTQDYSTYVDYFNATGQRIEQRIFHDQGGNSGGYTRAFADADNSQPWLTRTDVYNAAGQLISRTDVPG